MRYRVWASSEFAASWFPDGPTPAALAQAPMIAFERGDSLEDRYLRRRTRRRLDPPRHYVPGSEALAHAVRLGLGWGLLPDLQVPFLGAGLVELDPKGVVDVTLFWQQWRLGSELLERVATSVHEHARKVLR
jgi:LysR family transcriptional regulator (chromosome initiation inhibitor)